MRTEGVSHPRGLCFYPAGWVGRRLHVQKSFSLTPYSYNSPLPLSIFRVVKHQWVGWGAAPQGGSPGGASGRQRGCRQPGRMRRDTSAERGPESAQPPSVRTHPEWKLVEAGDVSSLWGGPRSRRERPNAGVCDGSHWPPTIPDTASDRDHGGRRPL